MREIERLIAEIAPRPDVPALIRALPIRKTEGRLAIDTTAESPTSPQPSKAVPASVKPTSHTTPLSPRRYKLQVTIGQETRDKLNELQALLSHQIPDGDPAEILDRALDALRHARHQQHRAPLQSPQSIRSGIGVRGAFHGDTPTLLPRTRAHPGITGVTRG
jgi:hypothetical protein